MSRNDFFLIVKHVQLTYVSSNAMAQINNTDYNDYNTVTHQN